MNLFKKATASVALVSLVSGVFSTGVAAMNLAEIEAATSLANKGVINKVDTVADFRLDATITRAEAAKVAAEIAGIEPNSSCEGKFSDVSATTPNTWVCGYVEALLEAGKLSANENYNPERNLSKTESLKMMLEAAGDEVVYDNATWQADFVAHAVANAYISTFTDYNTAATRGFVFVAADAAHEANSDDNILDDILNEIEGGDDDTTTDNGDDTPVVSGEGDLTVTLSASTPKGTDLPKGANGVKVLEFDVTADSEDVSITAMEFERTGFGSAAAAELAVYSDGLGRVSKQKSFNSDDEANVTFSPAVVVKAGETRTMTVRVNTESATFGEFAIKLLNVTASADVENEVIVSETFDVKDVAAAKLTVKNDGVNNTITSGEEQAELVEFNLKNEGSSATSADVDVTVSSVTLKEIGSIDQEDYLRNLTLSLNGEVISTVEMMEGKYVTFEFDGVVIEDGKNESFKVMADIEGGAGDKVQFELDNVVDIEATASRYNAVNVEMDTNLSTANGAFDEVTVDAGELTIYAVDAETDEIRGDKDDVVLGQLKIVNVAGKNLELDNLAVTIALSNTGGTADTLDEILENVEVEINGTSYDLNKGTGVYSALYSETDMDILLPQGTTYLTVRGDTLKDLTDGTTITMSLADAGNTGLVVVETEDDERVNDISPSSLSWDSVEVKNASVTVSNVPLADVKIVKGATDIVALQFEIEAGEASDITLDEVKVLVNASGSAATKNEISEVALYKGNVSGQALDRVSGSKLASGVATFEGFEVIVKADTTETFIVTVNTVDTTDVVGKVIAASLDVANLGLEDDENDTISLTSATISDKLITVLDSGSLTLTADANNEDNKNAKTILAGEEEVVYSIDAIAKNEPVKVETVTFTLSGTTNYKELLAGAKLYLDDTVVATANNSDVVNNTASGTITFDNISNLVFPTKSAELRLAIDTEVIGYEKIGTGATNLTVSNVAIADAEGEDSGEDVAAFNKDVTSAEFAVAPATVVVSVVESLSTGTAKVKVTVNTGDNTQADSAETPNIEVATMPVINLANGTSFTVYNADDVSNTGATVSALDADNRTVSGNSSETFVFVPQTTADGTTYTSKIAKDGLTYTVNGKTYTISMDSELDLGTKSY
jgi:hypothetical protein